MPPPVDRNQLKSFLGMISYYSCFVPKMRQMRGPLDDLEKDENSNGWKYIRYSFEKLKKVLQSDLLLTHFDPEMNIIIVADASDCGIGAIFHINLLTGMKRQLFM